MAAKASNAAHRQGNHGLRGHDGPHPMRCGKGITAEARIFAHGMAEWGALYQAGRGPTMHLNDELLDPVLVETTPPTNVVLGLIKQLKHVIAQVIMRLDIAPAARLSVAV